MHNLTFHSRSDGFTSTQASSEHSVCFAVPEKEVRAVAAALESRFRQALNAGRLSQVLHCCASIGTTRKSLITRFACRVCSKEMQVFCGVNIIIAFIEDHICI